MEIFLSEEQMMAEACWVHEGKYYSGLRACVDDVLTSGDLILGSYDIFLSHSIMDASRVELLHDFLSNRGYKVYVDWIEDRFLDRQQVSQRTADRLREMMRRSEVLIYAVSPGSTDSKWMKWELGYADGLGKHVAILPIVSRSQDDFKGEEFLGLYHYIVLLDGVLCVKSQQGEIFPFSQWVQGDDSRHSYGDTELNMGIGVSLLEEKLAELGSGDD